MPSLLSLAGISNYPREEKYFCVLCKKEKEYMGDDSHTMSQLELHDHLEEVHEIDRGPDQEEYVYRSLYLASGEFRAYLDECSDDDARVEKRMGEIARNILTSGLFDDEDEDNEHKKNNKGKEKEKGRDNRKSTPAAQPVLWARTKLPKYTTAPTQPPLVTQAANHDYGSISPAFGRQNALSASQAVLPSMYNPTQSYTPPGFYTQQHYAGLLATPPSLSQSYIPPGLASQPYLGPGALQHTNDKRYVPPSPAAQHYTGDPAPRSTHTLSQSYVSPYPVPQNQTNAHTAAPPIAFTPFHEFRLLPPVRQAQAPTETPEAADFPHHVRCDVCITKGSQECFWDSFGCACNKCYQEGNTCTVNGARVRDVAWKEFKKSHPEITKRTYVVPTYNNPIPSRQTRKDSVNGNRTNEEKSATAATNIREAN